jgi:hypothetical protein
MRQWIGRHFHLHILQQDRLQRATARDLDQRCNVTVVTTAMEANVRLNCRSAEMSVTDRLGRLQAHSLIAAVEQLG